MYHSLIYKSLLILRILFHESRIESVRTSNTDTATRISSGTFVSLSRFSSPESDSGADCKVGSVHFAQSIEIKYIFVQEVCAEWSSPRLLTVYWSVSELHHGAVCWKNTFDRAKESGMIPSSSRSSAGLGDSRSRSTSSSNEEAKDVSALISSVEEHLADFVTGLTQPSSVVTLERRKSYWRILRASRHLSLLKSSLFAIDLNSRGEPP